MAFASVLVMASSASQPKRHNHLPEMDTAATTTCQMAITAPHGTASITSPAQAGTLFGLDARKGAMMGVLETRRIATKYAV